MNDCYLAHLEETNRALRTERDLLQAKVTQLQTRIYDACSLLERGHTTAALRALDGNTE